MVKTKTLLMEDLSVIDWSKFDCEAVLHEVTGHIQIVCNLKPEYHLTPQEGDPSLNGNRERQKWNNMIGI